MTEIINATMSNESPAYDPRPQFFVKMFGDGSYTVVPADGKEIDQCTMELEYIPAPPTDEEKIAYALTLGKIKDLNAPDDIKRQLAGFEIRNSDFVMPMFDPNASRVHADPEYFFKTPCKPCVWCWKKGTQEEAIAAADKYRQKMISSGKWDIVVNVYKQQYNIVEV